MFARIFKTVSAIAFGWTGIQLGWREREREKNKKKVRIGIWLFWERSNKQIKSCWIFHLLSFVLLDGPGRCDKNARMRPKNSQCEKSVNENTHTFTESDSNGREKFVERKKQHIGYTKPTHIYTNQTKRRLKTAYKVRHKDKNPIFIFVWIFLSISLFSAHCVRCAPMSCCLLMHCLVFACK